MAVDSLKRQGASINVYAYDSEESESTVRRILSDPILKEMDLIIAPENDSHIKLIADFGLANDINVVNTFRLKTRRFRTMQKYSKPIFLIPIYMQKLLTDLSVIWEIGKSYFYLIHRKNPTKEILSAV